MDVQSFEQSVLGRSSQSQSTPQPDGQGVESESDEVKPTRRKVVTHVHFVHTLILNFTAQRTALLSIEAFLDDQSDD